MHWLQQLAQFLKLKYPYGIHVTAAWVWGWHLMGNAGTPANKLTLDCVLTQMNFVRKGADNIFWLVLACQLLPEASEAHCCKKALASFKNKMNHVGCISVKHGSSCSQRQNSVLKKAVHDGDLWCMASSTAINSFRTTLSTCHSEIAKQAHFET